MMNLVELDVVCLLHIFTYSTAHCRSNLILDVLIIIIHDKYCFENYQEFGFAWCLRRKIELSTSWRIIACRSKLRPALSVSFTFAPPASNRSATLRRFPLKRDKPSAELPSESFKVRLGMTCKLWPLWVTWTDTNTENKHFHYCSWFYLLKTRTTSTTIFWFVFLKELYFYL